MDGTWLSGRIALVCDDLTGLDVEAVVNAANETLLGGGGVDGAIHHAAGKGLLEECRALGGARTGEVKRTGGHRLRARHVLHAVGPIWRGGVQGEAGLLASCYEQALGLCRKHAVQTVAFPSISTGVYAYPVEAAARIAVSTVLAFLEASSVPGEVTFCVFSEANRGVYVRVLDELVPR